ncbi:hypothetical protein ACFYVL_30975 [Streptomyces sp. NPDC004111]|uniref:hypothetical protein n=1 Tax=Streptomyces sp. NPDC004111 TaxID=3364690 RepID=UPI0036A3DA99
MTARRVATTRSALLVLAAASLVGGAWLTLGNRALRQPDSAAARLPDWWPLPRAEAGAAGTHGWWAPAVMAGLAVVLLAALGWLFMLAVRGVRRRAPYALAGPRLSLAPDALADAMTAQVAELAGVSGARVVLDRAGKVPLARITVFLEHRSDPRAVLQAVEEGPLRHARAALAPTAVHADLRFRVRGHRTRRTR